MACLSLSVVITGRTQRQISQRMNRLGCMERGSLKETRREGGDHSERVREKTGNDEKGDGRGGGELLSSKML